MQGLYRFWTFPPTTSPWPGIDRDTPGQAVHKSSHATCLQERHSRQALGGKTTRVKVFAEDSEFRSFAAAQDFGSRLGRRDYASSYRPTGTPGQAVHKSSRVAMRPACKKDTPGKRLGE